MAGQKLTIVRVASAKGDEKLLAEIKHLERLGFQVEYNPPTEPVPDWPFSCADTPARARHLGEALLQEGATSILCARGGYGCSDVLPHLPWNKLKSLPEPRLLVGFSDNSALHSALWTKLGWQGLHAPMPASELWDAQCSDVKTLLAILQGQASGHSLSVSTLAAMDESAEARRHEGWLFGGCMSVLTNLIGTPYFPPSLDGAILFLEDTDETAPRLMRYWNQWAQSGATAGIQAVVLGQFRGGPREREELSALAKKMQTVAPVDFYHCSHFGHSTPNEPLMIGAPATVQKGTLSWTLTKQKGAADARNA